MKRKKRFIRKTKSGTFVADLYDQNGKRIRKAFKTYGEAAGYKKDAVGQVERREFVTPGKETVREIAERWLKKKESVGRYERSSLEQWKNHIYNHIAPSLGTFSVQDLDVAKIESAAAGWNERLSEKTVNAILTTLSAVLSLAKRYKLVRDNPVRDAERLKLSSEQEGEDVTPDRVYTHEEVNKLIDATETGSMERVIVMLLAYTGIRIGELTGLPWGAVDLKNGRLEVRQNRQDADKGGGSILKAPKSKSGRRTIGPLDEELIREMRLWKMKCPQSNDDLVVVGELGVALHRKSVSAILDGVIDRAEVKRLTPHGLRHTFASLLLANGVPVTEVSYLMGHKNAGITMTMYAHFIPKDTSALRDLAASIRGQRAARKVTKK